ncbi:hypothetical protein LPH45_05495 [Xylella taiwanensis]|uniref:Uncharacterized protein n=1 Tax=Xylella taiwanensis TaxID=1444770 RepID=A0ABS8TWB4_9GAMM|nr:hypothetical protein [Xylella taiwanensis]MCD8457855.1 hypothetical protein [Xylella taiwanensis]MCD8464496.1 hypothetical protein [Xylella taiwanensis]MCD8472779.1 hypothetical protein [Xylella taiwanensis]UFN07755.1 hypothetical protein LPH42_05470 [Xylella taiwanensis]UFN10050.1 hypothetical protein LPH45_05495 [Xylella taiwanensis]
MKDVAQIRLNARLPDERDDGKKWRCLLNLGKQSNVPLTTINRTRYSVEIN